MDIKAMRAQIADMRNEAGELPTFAWPGGYPMFYVTQGGLTVCPTCANKQDTSDEVVRGDVLWEGPEMPCDDCGKDIESAYGDPETVS